MDGWIQWKKKKLALLCNSTISSPTHLAETEVVSVLFYLMF